MNETDKRSKTKMISHNNLTSLDLDLFNRPAWNAMHKTHQHLSKGDNNARIYKPDINVFLATSNDDLPFWHAAEELTSPDQEVYTVQNTPIPVLETLELSFAAPCVQMIGGQTYPDIEIEHEILKLGQEDALEMLDLATLTEPGPFKENSFKMGDFIGIRIEGRLAAMAGERFRFSNFSEVSGICTHPDFQGRGLAKALTAIKSAQIVSRGERPFLHAWKTNEPAIQLYKKLGYSIFNEVTASVLKRKS